MTSTGAQGDPGGGLFAFWYARAYDSGRRPAWTALVQSDRHPDGTVLDLPEPEADHEVTQDDRVAAWARCGADGTVERLEVTDEVAPKAPPLWWAELQEPDASPPASTLLAFTGHGVEPGTLLDRHALRDVDVVSADQLGAYRWIPHSGFVDQLYVSPAWRRRTVATALVAAAGVLATARGWPRMWSDGQRTSDGERFREGGLWAHRTEELTHLMPPMTPPGER